MSARAAAATVAERLDAAGIPDPTLEAELLIRAAAKLTRTEYFAGAALSPEASDAVESLVERRLTREPLAYIAGHREFYGLDFAVGPGVLVPRPETELLVDIGLREIRAIDGPVRVADIGTGSGAVAIAVAKHAPGANVTASDVSDSALAIAAANASRHGVAIRFVRGDLASPVAEADLVLANLPYIPSLEIPGLAPEIADWEPRSALDGGPDGLDLIRRLIDDCAERLRPRLLALEVGAGQAGSVAAYARDRHAATTTERDLAGVERVVCCRWA